MARNHVLSEKTAQDIDKRVERVLRGLGHPEPPLRLEDVRELLKLDLDFYTADDPGILQETISRIRVAGIHTSGGGLEPMGPFSGSDGGDTGRL